MIENAIIIFLSCSSPDDYTLKVCGYEDYVWGSHKIVDFKHIRQ